MTVTGWRRAVAGWAAWVAVALACAVAAAQDPQQVLQVGALNSPSAVYTDGGQWANLVPVLSTAEQDVYAEDPSTDAWLARNAQAFLDRGQYRLTFVSFYKTPHPCRQDLIRAGFSDEAHMQACINDRYSVRTVTVDAPQNTVTVLSWALVTSGGALDPATVYRETRTRGFANLGADAQKAVSNATKLVAAQVHEYAVRQHLVP